MAEGRKATREERFSDAEDAFTAALRARPDDARAEAERGYARLLEGALEKAAEDFERALGRGLDTKLASQVFFNVGLLREKQNDAEGARAAFAIADAMSPSAAAKAKLAGRSACTADVRFGGGDALETAKDWDELHAKIQPIVELGSPKASVCVRSHTAMGDADDKDVCKGPPPWVLNHHHLHFTEDQFFVVPKKGLGFVYFQARVGAWPAHCTNLPFHEASLAGDHLHVKTTFDGSMAAFDESKAMDADGMQMPCNDVLGYESHAFYDTVTGKRRLHVYMPAKVPTPTIAIAGSKVTLTGAGCDRTIELAGPSGAR